MFEKQKLEKKTRKKDWLFSECVLGFSLLVEALFLVGLSLSRTKFPRRVQ